MDTFVEQIIAKRKTGREYAILLSIVLAALLVSGFFVLFAFLYIGFFAFLFVAGTIYGAWYLAGTQNVEFEYSITNGDIDIDTIISQRKRRRIVSVSGAKIESAAPYRPEEWTGRSFDRQVMAASSPLADGVWAFTYHSKKNGHTLVLFQPNEQVLEAFCAALPRLIQIELKRKTAS